MAAPTLNFIHGPVAGRRVEMGTEELTIGRGKQNDLTLEDPLVSRLHAIFMRRGDVVLLEDLGSHNGTYVNNERLHQIRQLHHGDTIVVGSSRALFEDPSVSPAVAAGGVARFRVPRDRPARAPGRRARRGAGS